MYKKVYLLPTVEIAGRFAMFANPASGAQLCSYPIPTPTALKGILECVHFMKQCVVRIGKVNICKKPVYGTFGFNATVSAWRKTAHRSAGHSLQRTFSPLCDVVYQIYAYVENIDASELIDVSMSERAIAYQSRNPRQNNAAHAYQSIFARKLRLGQFTRNPCLGKRIFESSYCGPVRMDAEGTAIHRPCEEVNFVVPNIPTCYFNKIQHGTEVSPTFTQNVEVKNGVVVFDARINSLCDMTRMQTNQGAFVNA